MRKDNKGFSMVELMIVIALMAVVGGVLVYSFSMVTGQQARQCASNLSTALDKAKNYSLTKSASSDAYVEIARETNGGYIATYYAPVSPINDSAVPGSSDYVQLEQESLGKRAVEVTCYMEGGTSFQITETNHLRVYYDRVSGAFKEAVAVSGASETTAFCSKIVITRGRTYEITFVNATGKHLLDRIS